MKFSKILLIFALFFMLTGYLDAAQKYDHELTEKGITFKWKVDGANLNVSLSAKTKGWVAVGFNPTKDMKDANFIIGYVKDGKVRIRDFFGVRSDAHKSDKKLGTKSDIKNKAGKEENGVTEISFTIPLDSKDKNDRPLDPKAETKVLLAYSDMDSTKIKHKVNAAIKVNLSTGKHSK